MKKHTASSASFVILTGLLYGSPCFAQAYSAPLTDQALLTEALWNMESAPGNVILDQDQNNKWRNHELNLKTPNGPVIGYSGRPAFGNSLVFDGVDDFAESPVRWSRHRAGWSSKPGFG
jgi:hypothetical protein